MIQRKSRIFILATNINTDIPYHKYRSLWYCECSVSNVVRFPSLVMITDLLKHQSATNLTQRQRVVNYKNARALSTTMAQDVLRFCAANIKAVE